MGTKSTPEGAAYAPPLDRLLGLGVVGARRYEWRDYTAMGLTREHVPELLRMSVDPELNEADEDDSRVYAPLHAWRALGQMRVAEAAAPLAELLLRYDDDWAKENLPQALGMIGEPALEPARAVLANRDAESFIRAAAARALHEIAERHPELRDRAVSMLTEQLRAWPEQDDALNGFLIDYLVELHAVEAAPLMQAAFEAGLADPSIRGDWEDIQVDLGLLEARLTPPQPLEWMRALNPLQGTPSPKVTKNVSPGEKARKQRKAQKPGKRKKK
ncbi:MAG TPA: DUF1186 domain-containing protein [Longimicrobium sp.]